MKFKNFLTKHKAKILSLFIIMFSAITLAACGKNKFELGDYLIEKREHLFTANDSLYSVTFSTGMREKDYNFDGIINEQIPFGVLTITRNDNLPLANDKYSYIVTINDQTYSGFLEKANNNSYADDLEANIVGDEKINVQISFTGYTFNKDLEHSSSQFQVDCDSAIKIAQKELGDDLKNLISDKNNKIEVVTKIMKDHSSEDLKSYNWYVGIISTNGNTMGVLIDANSGNIIAKKI